MRPLTCLLIAVLLSGLFSPAAFAETGRPVVAVFGIEDKTGRLDQQVLRQLSDYLSARVAAGGAFQVVPGSQLKERLVEQKKESYKDCYDQQCQIEIGREVAAQKSLATQIVAVGSKCALMATLYDLRRATSDGSATEKSECSQDELVGALEKAVASLTRKFRERAEGPRSTKGETGTLRLDGLPSGAEVLVDGVVRGHGPLRAALELAPGEHMVQVRAPGHRTWEKKVIGFPAVALSERVTLQAIATIAFETNPPGAALTLDGEKRGKTPVTLELDVGRRYALRFEHEGYDPIAEEVTVRKPDRLGYELTVGKRPRRSRNEWFGAELATGGAMGKAVGFVIGLNLRLITLKWPLFYWTILNLDAGALVRSGGPGLHSFVETHAGSQLYFGKRDQHQLRLGLGVGVTGASPAGFTSGCTTECVGAGCTPACPEKPLEERGYMVVHLSPAASYLYQTAGRFFFGVGLRVLIPVSESLLSESSGLYPGVTFMATLPIGWASLP